MSTQPTDEAHDTVRQHYAAVAKTNGAFGCGPGCCSPKTGASLELGYTAEDLASVPDGADMGLGCGTPLRFARLQPGETVLDLGSGGGIDCFLAAKQVGDTGQVIGVDMTSEMLQKARGNAKHLQLRNVSFRLGEIEALPLGDRSIDVIVSNCVINLSPDKASVFRESFRVLRAGGRIAISDIVASRDIPEEVRNDPSAIAGCIAGAPSIEELRAMLTSAGFSQVSIEVRPESRTFIKEWMPGSGIEGFVAAAEIRATKPSGDGCCDTAAPKSCC